jgi:hypothetical protein
MIVWGIENGNLVAIPASGNDVILPITADTKLNGVSVGEMLDFFREVLLEQLDVSGKTLDDDCIITQEKEGRGYPRI